MCFTFSYLNKGILFSYTVLVIIKFNSQGGLLISVNSNMTVFCKYELRPARNGSCHACQTKCIFIRMSYTVKLLFEYVLQQTPKDTLDIINNGTTKGISSVSLSEE